MNVAVILKRVPDTEATIVVDRSLPTTIVEDEVKFVLNPYDEYAIEEALTIAAEGDGETIGVCIGPEQAETVIRSGLAMGLNRAVLISDPEAVDADIITQCKILAAAIKDLDVSLVLCGREFIDTQDDAMAAAVAQNLDMPHVLNAGKIDLKDDRVTVIRDIEGGALEIEALLPAVISCQKGLNDPRYPTLIAIKRSKRKEIKKVTLSDLGIEIGAPKSRVVALKSPPPRAQGVTATGDPEDVVSQCLTWLADEAKLV